MSRIRASRSKGVVVYALITALMLPSATAVLGAPASPASGAAGPVNAQATLTMLVFPLREETGTGQDLVRIVTQALARTLEQFGAFDAQVFAMNSPSAMRQVEEGVLRTEDIAPPYEAATAVTVGHAMGVDVVLVGSIMERTVDKEKNTLSLTVSGTTYAIADNVDPETGTPKTELQPFRPLFAVTGISLERKVAYPGPVSDLEREAAMDAAKKAAARITGVTVAPKPKKKPKFLGKWGAVALVTLAAVGFALAAQGGDNQPVSAAPPPTSLAMTQQNQGVRLSWSPPLNPPRSILRYHVQRRVNNGPQHDISGALVLPTQFSVIDFDVSVGDRIEYFIRCEYVGSVRSVYVSFGTFIVPA